MSHVLDLFNIIQNPEMKKRSPESSFSLLNPLYFASHINCILSAFEIHTAAIKTLYSIEPQSGMLIISRYITEEENKRRNQ